MRAPTVSVLRGLAAMVCLWLLFIEFFALYGLGQRSVDGVYEPTYVPTMFWIALALTFASLALLFYRRKRYASYALIVVCACLVVAYVGMGSPGDPGILFVPSFAAAALLWPVAEA